MVMMNMLLLMMMTTTKMMMTMMIILLLLLMVTLATHQHADIEDVAASFVVTTTGALEQQSRNFNRESKAQGESVLKHNFEFKLNADTFSVAFSPSPSGFEQTLVLSSQKGDIFGWIFFFTRSAPQSPRATDNGETDTESEAK